ncbi:MAG: M28 family peptidase [Gemmatimonas sp.]|nr:M28 family peptidase [Gemmatimonas sp.]
MKLHLFSGSRAAVSLVVLLFGFAPSALAQAQARSSWFGLPAPPGLGDPHRSPVAFEENFAARPVGVPDGEEINTALEARGILPDLETIVGFSQMSRAEGNQMWGRITGRPAAARTIDWVAGRFRETGLQDVEVQSFASTEEMWWPISWEVRLIGDPAYGEGSEDVILESAFPTAGSELASPITAPLAYAGPVSEPVDPTLEVAGKIAVQLLRPQGGAYSERGRTVEAARALIANGAVAVLNLVEQPGNMHVRDFSNCGGPCFNLGGADGTFLLSAIERAEREGLTPPLARLALQTDMLTDLTGQNAVGIVPGTDDGILIVNAHADGWFDAAGDNGDGLAVLLALAEHFVDPENQPVRTLVFVASAGHHSRGMNGPSHFVQMNPDIAARTEMVVNLEHVAQLGLDTGDGRFLTTEQPMNFGISNQAPYLIDVARRGLERYGFRINPTFPANVPGDLGGYSSLGVPRVQAIHAGPLYHTSGDVLESISGPGIERAARFFAYFIRETARAPREWIDP